MEFELPDDVDPDSPEAVEAAAKAYEQALMASEEEIEWDALTRYFQESQQGENTLRLSCTLSLLSLHHCYLLHALLLWDQAHMKLLMSLLVCQSFVVCKGLASFVTTCRMTARGSACLMLTMFCRGR